MKINNISKIATLIGFVSMTLASCTEEIDMKLNTTSKRLVVDGILTTDTMAQCIKLSTSGDYFDNQPMPGVSGALVTLNDGDETLTLTEISAHKGWYYTPSDLYGKQGHTYTLNIENVDINNDGVMESYSASNYMNYLVPIDSIDIGYVHQYDLWQVLMYAKEPGETEDYYMFRVTVNDTLITNKYSKQTVTDDQFVNGNNMDGVWIYSLDAKDSIENLMLNDTVMLEMFRINEHTYDYMSALATETQPKTPLFSGPSANVPGNISNGALGIFAVCPVSRSKTIVRITKDN
jgi:hypothetical protein